MSKNSVNKPSWLNLINIDSVYSVDKQRQAFSLFTMIAISVVVITLLVFLNYAVYSPILTSALVIVNITILSCAVYFIKSGKLETVALISLSIVCLMFVVLVYTGGKENTALYWLMFYPVVTFASLGIRFGAWLGFALLFCCIVILYGPNFGQVLYGSVEKTRFIAAFSIVLLFSFISEYFRHKSHMAIAGITLEQKQDAYTDPLTGIANRRFITAHFLNLAKSKPEHYLPFSILLIDLDNFKLLNDTYGHGVGDTVLIKFTELLEFQFPATALKARYGGEEFVVILQHVAVPTAVVLANKFREAVAEHVMFTNNNKPISITCSIGIAQVNKVTDYNDSLKQADEFLYSAKAAGRNTVVSSLASSS